MPDRSRSKVLLALVVLWIVWGSTYLAIRYAVLTIPPFFMAGVRFLIAGGLLYIWMRWRGVSAPRLKEWRASGIVGIWLMSGNGMVVWAEKIVPSGLAALLVSITPLWFALFENLQRGTRPDRRTLCGMALGFAGVALLVNPGQNLAHIDAWGVTVLLGSSAAWAMGSIYARQAPLPSSPFMATAAEMLAGGVWLLAIGLLMGEWRVLRPASISHASIGGLIYLIVIGSLVGFTAYVWLLKNTSLARLSTYSYVNPVVAVFLGWGIAGETITLRTLVAAGIILSSVILILRVPPELAPKRLLRRLRRFFIPVEPGV